MRFLLITSFIVTSYFSHAQKGYWQLSALQGQSYSSGGEYSIGYPDKAYKSIGILAMPSFKFGISRTRQLKKRLDFEYGLNYQFMQYKVVYEPFDSTSVYGVLLTNHRKFNFFEFHVNILKNISLSKKWFFTTGGGIALHYAFYMTSEGIRRGKYNPLKPSYYDLENYESKMTEQPTFNYSYFAFLGVGKKLGVNSQEISLRVYIQHLQGTYLYDGIDNTRLHSKGISIVYTFGKLSKNN